MTVETKQSVKALSICVGSKVTLIQADLKGIVRAVLINNEGVQYSVNYWAGDNRKVDWVFAEEISEGWD